MDGLNDVPVFGTLVVILIGTLIGMVCAVLGAAVGQFGVDSGIIPEQLAWFIVFTAFIMGGIIGVVLVGRD